MDREQGVCVIIILASVYSEKSNKKNEKADSFAIVASDFFCPCHFLLCTVIRVNKIGRNILFSKVTKCLFRITTDSMTSSVQHLDTRSNLHMFIYAMYETHFSTKNKHVLILFILVAGVPFSITVGYTALHTVILVRQTSCMHVMQAWSWIAYSTVK